MFEPVDIQQDVGVCCLVFRFWVAIWVAEGNVNCKQVFSLASVQHIIIVTATHHFTCTDDRQKEVNVSNYTTH
jgi:hypothetical protein